MSRKGFFFWWWWALLGLAAIGGIALLEAIT
jgi:hypothetical protein